MTFFTNASPSPLPSSAWEVSPCQNLSKILLPVSSLIPHPESATVTVVSFALRAIETDILPPVSVNLTALDSRLFHIRSSRSLSDTIFALSGKEQSNSTPFSSALSSKRRTLSAIMEKANIVIDTSKFKLPEFKTRVLESTGVSVAEPSVIVSSFGFKYGAPEDADYILDVRFLPNPNYVDDLHMLSGKDEAVRKYLNGFPSLKKFLDMAVPLLDYVASVYCETGKKQLHICFGCTGGRHRSVAVAEIVGAAIASTGKRVVIPHRDIDKGGAR